MCHLVYVLFTMTTIGMFFDEHPLSAFCEFARCSFFFMYSLKGIPLLSNVLVWSGMVDFFGAEIIPQVLLILRGYFLVSSVSWAFIAAFKAYETSPNAKEKVH